MQWQNETILFYMWVQAAVMMYCVSNIAEMNKSGGYINSHFSVEFLKKGIFLL